MFTDSVAAIDEAYARLGHTLGWRFLYGPSAVLDGPVDIALVTLNPGGDTETDAHPRASCEHGLAFVVERWGRALSGEAKLQRQFQGLFAALAAQPTFDGDAAALMARSALASLIPFRSSTFVRLASRAESIAFGRALWATLLPRLDPRLIVVLGREAQAALRCLLPRVLGLVATERTSYPTGWGTIEAEIDEYAAGGRIVRLLYLPHLSRYTLFTSVRCAPAMATVVAAAVRDL
ncbi:MAG: hypothetical protein ABI277_06575 [Burkholderiaceae bacterium]